MKQNSENQSSFKPSFFQKFFWFCSGVDVDLLVGNYSEFPKPLKTEFNKYIGVGTAVFFTSIFASISASFAISFMEGSKWWICIICGIIWGINIFFLDRYIVATMRKNDNWKQELLYALPRILIGLVFAFTISVPIELSLFNGKIQDELSKYNTGRVSSCEKDCNDEIVKLNNQISALDDKVKAKQKEQPQGYQELLIQQKGIQSEISQLSSEISNNAAIINSNRVLNTNYPENNEVKYKYNETAKKYQYQNRLKSNEISNKRSQLSKINTEIQAKFKKFQEELDRLITQVEQQKEPIKQLLVKNTKDCPIKISECQRVAKGNVDLLSRYDALGRAQGSWFSSIWWACKMILLLFIFLELAPVLSKLISTKGSYDDRLEYIESQEKLIVSKRNNEINETLLEIQNENAKDKEIRNASLEAAKIKAETLVFEMQQNEKLIQHNIEKDANHKIKEQELLAIIKSQEISEQLEEAKATYSISIETIKKGEAAEIALQEKIAKYVSEKQFEQLKGEIDTFFESAKGKSEIKAKKGKKEI